MISTVPPDYTNKLAEQVHRDYTPSDMAASQRVTNGFGPLYCLAASLRNCFTAVPSITKKTGWRRPGFPKGIHAKALHQSQPAGQAPENDDSVKDARPTHQPSPSKMEEAATIHPFLGKKARGQGALRLTLPHQAPPGSAAHRNPSGTKSPKGTRRRHGASFPGGSTPPAKCSGQSATHHLHPHHPPPPRPATSPRNRNVTKPLHGTYR